MANNSFSDYKLMLDWLFDLQRRGIKTGLSHTRQLLAACGNPQAKYPIIHVAGTNGKGSTCAMIAAIMKTAGYRVGLYTSPHLLHFNERIRVNGIPIDNSAIIDFIADQRVAIDRIESTFFEATTAMALWYFANENVDVAIVETGLGGRLDSTNIVGPAVTAITPIDLDHTDLLGTTIDIIAGEKAGIIKPGIPVVIAPQEKAAERVLIKQALQLGASVIKVETDANQIAVSNTTGTSFKWRGNQFSMSLYGQHQAWNACCALETVRAFDPAIDAQVLAAGLIMVKWPGRMQKLKNNPPVFYDVAHNRQGISTVLDILTELFSVSPVGVFVMKGDKDSHLIAEAFKDRLDSLIITGDDSAGLMAADKLYQMLQKTGLSCELIPDFQQASAALQARISGDKPGIILGSHYIAAKVFDNYGFSFESGII